MILPRQGSFRCPAPTLEPLGQAPIGSQSCLQQLYVCAFTSFSSGDWRRRAGARVRSRRAARFGVCVLSAGVCSGAGEDLRRARRVWILAVIISKSVVRRDTPAARSSV